MRMPPAPQPASGGRHRLARRLILLTVLCSGVVALVISALQVALEHRRGVLELERHFALVEESYLPSLMESAWLVDREQMRILVEGLGRLPYFGHVAVTVDGTAIASSGERLAADMLERRWPLARQYRDDKLIVGELTVQASLAGVRAANRDRIVFAVLANLLQAAIVAAVLFLLVRWLITRHLEHIADYVGTVDPWRLTPSLVLERPVSRTPDEIDRLVGALNRTAAQTRVSQSQLRLAASVFEHAAEGIVIADARSRIGAVNRKFCETTGYAPEDVLGQTPRILKTGRHDRAFYAEMWRQLRDNGSWSGELWNRRKDGSHYPEWLSISAVRDGSGSVAHYIGMYYDLSELFAAKQALRESEAQLRLITDHVPAIISYLDRDLRYRFTNRRFEEAFGRAPGDVLGRHLREVVGEADYGPIEDHFREALNGRAVSYQRTQRTAAGGEARHFRAYLVPHVAADDRVLGCYAMTIDVSAEVRQTDELEREVAERTASLAAANRELESFSYTVSHDLRAPLRHIVGFVGALGESAAVRADAEAMQLVERTETAARRLGRMIEALLRSAQLGRQELRPETVELQALVAALREELSAGLGARRVAWDIGTLPAVRADPTLLRLALQNLLDNALKYTSGRNPARIEVSVAVEADTVTLCVRDNGAGFDMKDAGKLFGTFARMHDEAQFPGTGIGLAHVKRIVERHGGTIRAEAVPDHGAAFFVTLPR
ncbi:MAG: PAS domain S-box protein [Burkholderiales bacterium]